MQGWRWPVFEIFRTSGTCLPHHTKITVMHVCASRFDKPWHGAKSSHSLFLNASCCAVRCKNGVRDICHAWFQHDLVIRRIAIRRTGWKVAALDISKLDVQKGGGSGDRSQVSYDNALMSSSSKFKGVCIYMTRPLWHKWHSCHVEWRAGFAILAREHCRRMSVKRQKLLLAVAAEYCLNMFEWRRRIIWASNQISDLWMFCFHLFSVVRTQAGPNQGFLLLTKNQ